METMKVEAGDSRDEKFRETFNPFTPDVHLRPPADGKQTWGYSYYPTKRVSPVHKFPRFVVNRERETVPLQGST